MDTSVGLNPSKLRTDEVSFEEPKSIEVSVESSLSTEVSFGLPVPMKRLFDAPPSLEPPHADKNTEIESTLAEKNVRVILSYPFLNQLNYFHALVYICQYLIAYWFTTRHFSVYHLDDSKSVFHFCKNTQTRSYQTDQHLMARRYRESSAGAKKPFSHLCATYCETRHD